MTSDTPIPASTTLHPAWRGLVDDAAIFPPGSADLAAAVAAYDARTAAARGLVASFVVTDERIPELREQAQGGLPLSVVVTGGAGAISGAARLATRGGTTLHALEIALRDLDDLPRNARRVVAAVDEARDAGVLDEEVPVFVELPGAAGAGWLAAADVVAERAEEGLRLKLRTGGTDAQAFPSAPTLSAWIDAALDRELPFKCTAGLHHALRHTDPSTGFEHHGFLNVLTATVRAFDGSTPDEVVALLERRDADTLLDGADPAELARARRWLTSFGSCSVDEPLADLAALGLLEDR